MKEEINELKSLLERSNPILFTGSGFSKFAKTKTGNELPDGSVLKDNILRSLLKFKKTSPEYIELMNNSLSEVCDYCIQIKTERHLEDFLTDIYSDCKPAKFHFIFSKYHWKKIYTTNIDDIIENSFDPNKLNVQNLDRPKVTNSSGKIEYLKLHGCVRNPSGKFVFSSKDYIDSMMKSRDYRFNQFGQDIQFEDFIFIGTDNNEVNLDYYLQLYESSGGVSSKGRLFFINPFPSIIFRSKVEKIGGKLIAWTTEEFASFLNEEITKPSFNAKLPERLIDGFFNFNSKTEHYSKITNYSSNLYLGFEPKWLDIYFDWDFRNDEIIDNFEEFLSYVERYNIKKSIYSLVGKSLIGKSVYLKRLGHILFQSDYEVLEFRGKRFDYFSFIKYVQKSPNSKFCLLIDNASYYYGALKPFLRRFPRNSEIVILTASRPYFHNRKKYSLVTEDFYEHYVDQNVTEELAIQIESKLEEKGFLGSLKKHQKPIRISKILASNDITSTLFNITYGKGFYRRFQNSLSSSYKHLSFGKEILTSLAVFQLLDLSYIPLELITLIYQTKTKGALKEIEDFVKINEDNRIELRNIFLANPILRKLTKYQIITNIKELLVSISPQVSDEIHSYWNEIQATLMKEKLLRKRLHLKSREIKNLLFEIQSYYNDNYNYWLQVGIAEQMEYEFDKALNHFRQAESLSPNSYMVQNAIARNFLKQANSQKDLIQATPYFNEGERLIVSLIHNREEFQVKAFSTHCYLYEKINYLRKFNISPSNQELKELFRLLSNIIDKTPDDGMSKHISNHFYKYLKDINKTSIIDIKFQDLSKLKALFEQYNIDIESIFEDFEIDE